MAVLAPILRRHSPVATWTNSNKITVSISGIKSTDGQSLSGIRWAFYSDLVPLWSNPDMIALDMHALVTGLTSEAMALYMYEASLDAYRGIKDYSWYTGWRVPDPYMSLDDMIRQGFYPEEITAIDDYVRYRTEWILINDQFPILGINKQSMKKLGDFTINRKGSVQDLYQALQRNISPRMNEAYQILTGYQKNKPSPMVVMRGCSPVARTASLMGRLGQPPAFRLGRDWHGGHANRDIWRFDWGSGIGEGGPSGSWGMWNRR